MMAMAGLNSQRSHHSGIRSYQLPSALELLPLHQALVPPALAFAFGIASPDESSDRTEPSLPPSSSPDQNAMTQRKRQRTEVVSDTRKPSTSEPSFPAAKELSRQQVAPAANSSYTTSCQEGISHGLSSLGSHPFLPFAAPFHQQFSLHHPPAAGLLALYGAHPSMSVPGLSGSLCYPGLHEYSMEYNQMLQQKAQASSGRKMECEDDADDTQARALKRPRLVWTPQLHKCFEQAVQKLGVDKAVPKNIMSLMNVEGLTRENVASHLQKYRLAMKKQSGTEDEEERGAASGSGGEGTGSNTAAEEREHNSKQQQQGAGGGMQAGTHSVDTSTQVHEPAHRGDSSKDGRRGSSGAPPLPQQPGQVASAERGPGLSGKEATPRVGNEQQAVQVA